MNMLMKCARFLLLGGVFCLSASALIRAGEKKPGREEGEFKIYLLGKDIGTEKYSIEDTTQGINSNSVVEFRQPDGSQKKVRIETHLEMNAQYVPRSYKCTLDINGEKGEITSNITPNEAMFEYRGGERDRRGGLLVGDRYTILDTNVFHHFIFLVRLFDFSKGTTEQKMEVVIPQGMDDGTLKLKELGQETILVRGKKVAAHHLQADSGSVVMDLWVDERHLLQKIAVPGKAIEVIRAR